jgi:antitoxin (DNA-binding transcriptional repressor) of toxin-antitoxin stability system
MQTVTATDLARRTRDVLDQVIRHGETVMVERNSVVIARISPITTLRPLPGNMTAAEALAGLPLPILSARQGAAWLQESKASFDDAVGDPWA